MTDIRSHALTTTMTPVSTRQPLIGPRLATVALVGGALLNGAESIGMHLLLPERPKAMGDQLRLVAEHEATYTALTVAGTLAIPLMGIGFVVLAQHLRTRSARLGSTAAWLLLSGMWGFLGIHLMSLMQVPFARSGDVAGAAGALEAAQQDPVLGLLFMAPFLLGTFAGMIVLAAGLLKTGAMPRWIPLTMLAFVVVDFVLRNPGPVDAHWLWIAACIGAAHHLRRDDRPALAA
ncbi:hypothetical protein ACOCJ4_00815 [Knoellia sp. CPCC 206435]|uniref:hypothetical protein n=1 Tax=Knoellia terrae TaxID=3404797 RepID=UPI003B42B255